MKKFAIIYGELSNGIQKRALEELTTTLLEYTLEYPLCFRYDPAADLSEYKCIYVGTKKSNPYIRENSQTSLSIPEEYSITVKNSVAVIEGYDDAGALYGAIDFYNKYIIKHEHPETEACWINFLLGDTLPDFEHVSAPAVKERGLWTWGHVIYDYKKYIDNMMKLKMNRVIIWNDFAPANGNDIVEYAHDRNIQVIWGFSWLWDTHLASSNITDLSGKAESIIKKYDDEYAALKGDGIYFQTFTEVYGETIGGVLIAKAAADFVNETAALFYEKYPNLEIQFGLHAISVKDKLEFIRNVDPRLRIVWEDCGAFPFSYVPTDIDTFDETKDFVNTIARLRSDNDRFGVVTKGLVKLDWQNFEHLNGPQYIGLSSDFIKENRIARKRHFWKYVQAHWLTNADKVLEMIREMYTIKNGDLISTALVEDGMFEENIMYPVALYSEMLWDCHSDVKELVSKVALRSYVTFA